VDSEEIKIDTTIYSESNEPHDILEETTAIRENVDEQFIDKVVRITIKGQLDGN